MRANKSNKVTSLFVNSRNRSQELKQFLRAMRARLRPEDVGLPASDRRRRAPGLRIEEAAIAAGVGLTWYTALEAGKNIRVSEKLLDRVADALRLTAPEREHLFALAQRVPSPSAQDGGDVGLQAAIEGFTAGPAFVCDRFWNVYACNALANLVYGHDTAGEKNLLVRMMLDPKFRALHEDWDRIAQKMVGILHLAFGRDPNDPAGIELVEHLSAESAPFAAWWNTFELSRYTPTEAVVLHPTLGRLALLYTGFVAAAMTDREDRLMIVLQSPIDEATRKKLGAALQSSL
jgi:transcriptional regulator with XRE-family HTH domain